MSQYLLVHLNFCGPDSSVGIATGYRLDGPGIESRWARDFSHLSRPALRTNPASCIMGTGSFPGVKSGRGVTLTFHPLLVPWSWKSRAIPLLPLWAVRPVQSLSACTKVHFTLYISSSCSGRIRFDSCSLYPQNEIGPSISSSVVLCVFVLLVYIVVLV